MKTAQGILILFWLLNFLSPAFAQEGQPLADKVKKLEAAMAKKDLEISEMKKTIFALSKTVENLRPLPGDSVSTEPPETKGRPKIFKTVKLARRKLEDEKIRAAIEEEKKRRVVVGASGTGVFQQIIDSKNSRDTSFAEGSLDFIFVSHPIAHTTFFGSLKAAGGEGPDQTVRSNAGLNADAGSLQDTDGVDRVALSKAWIGGDYFNDHLEGAVGKIDLTNYFDANLAANDETSQFLSSVFVNNPTLQQPGNGPGAIAFYDTRKSWRFGAGMQHSSNSGFAVADHPYFISEAEYTTHLFYGYEGNYRLWGHLNGARSGDNKGFGVSADQILFPALTAFVRYGLNQPKGAMNKYAWSTGFEKKRLFPSRSSDALGIAFGQQEGVAFKVDSLTEIYYRFFLSDHLSVSPHLQWLIRSSRPDLAAPAGTLEKEKNVFVAGLRSQVDF